MEFSEKRKERCRRERQALGVKLWEREPSSIPLGMPPPDDLGELQREAWLKALELQQQLLRADPTYFDDESDWDDDTEEE